MHDFILAGIFVGGASRRMGGAPKGLLPAAGGGPTIVERWRSLLADLGVRAVLVGRHPAYADVAMEVVADEVSGVGPLGGLLGLLRRAGQGAALALGCDMPFVSPAVIRRLVDAPREALIVAPRRDGRWEPLCARYDGPGVLGLAIEQVRRRDHSLQRLLDRAGALELSLDPAERLQLRDWDTPDDVARE